MTYATFVRCKLGRRTVQNCNEIEFSMLGHSRQYCHPPGPMEAKIHSLVDVKRLAVEDGCAVGSSQI
jgi:hypothetical protein